MKMNKTEQLQIRLSPVEKARIKRAARSAKLPMSDWVLSRLLPDSQQQLHELVAAIVRAETPSYPLASLNDFLAQLTADEFKNALLEKPLLPGDEYLANYITAMIEYTAHTNKVAAPDWVADIRPLNRPRFASNLKSLRRHLLMRSPPPFRNRNIFIDSTVGDRL